MLFGVERCVSLQNVTPLRQGQASAFKNLAGCIVEASCLLHRDCASMEIFSLHHHMRVYCFSCKFLAFFFFSQGIDEAAARDQEALDAAKTKLGANLTNWAEEHGKKKSIRKLLCTMHTVSRQIVGRTRSGSQRGH